MDLQAFYGISPHVNYVQAQSLPARSQRYIDPDHVLTYVQSGAVEMELLGREYTISPGEMILVPPPGGAPGRLGGRPGNALRPDV